MLGSRARLAAQSSEPGRAFGNPLSHVCRCVEVPRFFPQPSRLFHLAGVFFEYRQRPKRVREVEWRRFLVAPVKCERLVVARLGQFRPTRILMDVTQMSNRVCQGERIAFVAANGDRFLVQRSRCIATPQVSLDLAKPLECLHQFALHTSLATQRHRVGPIPMCVGRSILTPRAIRLSHELDDGF